MSKNTIVCRLAHRVISAAYLRLSTARCTPTTSPGGRSSDSSHDGVEGRGSPPLLFSCRAASHGGASYGVNSLAPLDRVDGDDVVRRHLKSRSSLINNETV